eukprot:scaffold12543_cov115-Isochrysis_galbana.AAC.9
MRTATALRVQAAIAGALGHAAASAVGHHLALGSLLRRRRRIHRNLREPDGPELGHSRAIVIGIGLDQAASGVQPRRAEQPTVRQPEKARVDQRRRQGECGGKRCLGVAGGTEASGRSGGGVSIRPQASNFLLCEWRDQSSARQAAEVTRLTRKAIAARVDGLALRGCGKQEAQARLGGGLQRRNAETLGAAADRVCVLTGRRAWRLAGLPVAPAVGRFPIAGRRSRAAQMCCRWASLAKGGARGTESGTERKKDRRARRGI